MLDIQWFSSGGILAGCLSPLFFAALRRSFAELGMEFRPDIACCTPLVLKPYFPRA